MIVQVSVIVNNEEILAAHDNGITPPEKELTYSSCVISKGQLSRIRFAYLIMDKDQGEQIRVEFSDQTTVYFKFEDGLWEEIQELNK